MPLQFAVKPGDEIFRKDITCEIIKKISLSERDKERLLEEYLDMRRIRIPFDETDLVVERRTTKKPNILEKSMTLPCSFESDDSCGSSEAASCVGVNGNKNAFSSKAAKQLHTITKHFGSLGRMSKRIKKNLGSLARRGTSFRSHSKSGSTSPLKKDSILEKGIKRDSSKETEKLFPDYSFLTVAYLHTEKRHEYHDEMIRNYLNTARARFLRQQREKKSVDSQRSNNSPSSVTSSASIVSENSLFKTSATQCVNTGCKSPGSSSTNYLCSSCFTEQKEELFKTKFSFNGSGSDKPPVNHLSLNIKQNDEISEVPLSNTASKTNDSVVKCANSQFYVVT